MIYLLLILSMLMSVGKALSCKKIGVVSGDFKSLMSTNSGVFLVAALCVFASLIGELNSIVNISRYSLMLLLQAVQLRHIRQRAEPLQYGRVSVVLMRSVFILGQMLIRLRVR